MLNILAQYEVPSGLAGSLGVHRQIEALKHGFAVRMNLGDPDYVNISKVVSDMLSPNFARTLQKTINDNKTFDPGHYGGRYIDSILFYLCFFSRLIFVCFHSFRMHLKLPMHFIYMYQ